MFLCATRKCSGETHSKRPPACLQGALGVRGLRWFCYVKRDYPGPKPSGCGEVSELGFLPQRGGQGRGERGTSGSVM
eukprot:844737-Pyramimonas_sp.AAC.1